MAHQEEFLPKQYKEYGNFLYLDDALFCCCTQVHQTAGFTPFDLVHGIDPVLPGNSTKPLYFKKLMSGMLSNFGLLFERMGQDSCAANKRLQSSANQAKERCDRLVQHNSLLVGQWVLKRLGN